MSGNGLIKPPSRMTGIRINGTATTAEICVFTVALIANPMAMPTSETDQQIKADPA